MKKILFFTLPFWGHINPNIDIIIQLSQTYKVLCVTLKNYSDIFFKNEIDILEYPDSLVEYYGNGIISKSTNIEKKYYASQYLMSEMLHINKRSIELLENIWFEIGLDIIEFAPDLIISDTYAFWGPPIANKINVKYINIESATDMKDKVQDKYFKKYLQDVVSKEINLEINTQEIIKNSNIINRQQNKKFEKFAGCNKESYSQPLITLAHMTKSLQLAADDMIIPYKYMGFDLEINDMPNKEDFIYISRGTINDNYNEMVLKNIISTFDCEKEYSVIVSCGVRADTIIQQNTNPKIQIYKSVNQIEYLLKSKLFISHGGITGIREAIICETPVIIFPTTYHCYQVGIVMENIGGGILLKNHPFDKQELKVAISEIMNNKEYKKNIKELKYELICEKRKNDIFSVLNKYM